VRSIEVLDLGSCGREIDLVAEVGGKMVMTIATKIESGSSMSVRSSTWRL